MATSARAVHLPEREYSEETRNAVRSLWRVINNEAAPESARRTPAFDPAELQRTLELVRQSIRAERMKVAELQQRVAELEGFEQASQAERLFSQELRADRDCWRGQAMSMMSHLPQR